MSGYHRRRAYLIYHPPEAEKNRHFIQMFQEWGRKAGIIFTYVPFGEYDAADKWDLPDLVLNRTRDPHVSEWYQQRDIPVFHCGEMTALANHKFQMLRYLDEKLPEQVRRQRWCPKSILISATRRSYSVAGLGSQESGAAAEKGSHGSYSVAGLGSQEPCTAARQRSHEPCSVTGQNSQESGAAAEKGSHGSYSVAGLGSQEPCTVGSREAWADLWRYGIVKSPDGHGGSEVFLARDISQWEKCLDGREIVLQERVESDSRDLRVYVLGGEIYQAVLRTGTKDFRSNHSLGGEVRAWKLTARERGWVEHFIRVMPQGQQGMYGIDFIVDRSGGLVFNEVEEMVGCRMLYQCTDRDIVRDYVAWLSDTVR